MPSDVCDGRMRGSEGKPVCPAIQLGRTYQNRPHPRSSLVAMVFLQRFTITSAAACQSTAYSYPHIHLTPCHRLLLSRLIQPRKRRVLTCHRIAAAVKRQAKLTLEQKQAVPINQCRGVEEVTGRSKSRTTAALLSLMTKRDQTIINRGTTKHHAVL